MSNVTNPVFMDTCLDFVPEVLEFPGGAKGLRIPLAHCTHPELALALFSDELAVLQADNYELNGALTMSGPSYQPTNANAKVHLDMGGSVFYNLAAQLVEGDNRTIFDVTTRVYGNGKKTHKGFALDYLLFDLVKLPDGRYGTYHHGELRVNKKDYYSLSIDSFGDLPMKVRYAGHTEINGHHAAVSLSGGGLPEACFFEFCGKLNESPSFVKLHPDIINDNFGDLPFEGFDLAITTDRYGKIIAQLGVRNDQKGTELRVKLANGQSEVLKDWDNRTGFGGFSINELMRILSS